MSYTPYTSYTAFSEFVCGLYLVYKIKNPAYKFYWKGLFMPKITEAYLKKIKAEPGEDKMLGCGDSLWMRISYKH